MSSFEANKGSLCVFSGKSLTNKMSRVVAQRDYDVVVDGNSFVGSNRSEDRLCKACSKLLYSLNSNNVVLGNGITYDNNYQSQHGKMLKPETKKKI